MYENDYMYAIERSDDYLAHYGVMGMKWGVRKAIASGNSARLGRQYAKASKKLAKLEKRAAKSGKYARRAALMGAGAAAAGGLAALGTSGVNRVMNVGGAFAGRAQRSIGRGITAAGRMLGNNVRGPIGKAGVKMMNVGYGMERGAKGTSAAIQKAGYAVGKWGNSKSVGQGIQNAAGRIAGQTFKGKNAAFNIASRDAARNATKGIAGMSNNTIARIGAGAVGAGLAIGAAKNAYRAATAKRKAEKFRNAMNESFKGTKYANGGGNKPRQGKKRRR